MAGRSSIERLPRPIQALVQEAIAEGATIDEIVRLIRAHGGTCSRSAVVRYVKRARERLQRWSEDRGLVDFWLKSQGERPEGGTGRLALETLRSLALRAAIALDREEAPPTADQIAPLALAMHRIEGAGKSGADRESAVARMDAGRNKTPKGGGGLSPEAVAIIRAEVEGDWHGWSPETHDEGAHRLDIDSHPMRRSGPS